MARKRPALMGILNVTPDSFSDGGKFIDHDEAISHALTMVKEGATIIDIGGESTRPGAKPVDTETEISRTAPIVEALAYELSDDIRISIDTRKEQVAEACLSIGATILNDVSASLFSVAAKHKAAWIGMHMRGDPKTMQDEPIYQDVVFEVSDYLANRANDARTAGVSEVYVDPGIGFGKNLDHNLTLLKHLDEVGRSAPLVVGASRKSMIGTLTAKAPVNDRLAGSVAIALWCAEKNVEILRIHDVAATNDALESWAAKSE